MEEHGVNIDPGTGSLRTRLAELRVAMRRSLAIRGLAGLALALLGALAVTFILDWWLRLTQGQRALVSGLALVGVGLVIWRWLVTPLSRRLPDEELALVLDNCFPAAADRFITAVETMASPAGKAHFSEQLLGAVLRQADEEAAKISSQTPLDRERLGHWLAGGAGALGMVALIWACFPATMNIWFQRDVLLREVAWPQATYLTVVGFGEKPIRVMRGGTLDLVVEAHGRRIPDSVRLEMQFTGSGRFREELSASGGGRFTRRLEGVVEPFRFWASGGDAVTPVYAVVLVEPPLLNNVKFRAVYPEYTGLTAKIFGLGEGNLEVPVGTILELAAVSSKPLKSGRVFFGDKEIGPVTLADRTRISQRLKIVQSGRLRLALDDEEGFTSDSAFSYPVVALPDRAPVLRLAVSGVGERVTKVATVPLSIEARDDYGVTAMEMRFGKTDFTAAGAPLGQTMPFKNVSLPSRLARLDTIWPLETVGLQEGETVYFRVEAHDAAEVPAGGNHAESTTFALRIVSAAEILEEFQRRQKAFRTEFERLTNRQREVVDATRLLRDRVNADQSLAAVGAGAGSPSAIVADERDIGNGCENLREQFLRVLTEMRNNRVSTESDYQRLEFRIAGPLHEVSQALLGETAPAMERIQPTEATAALQPKLEAQVEQQTRAYEQMTAILADMVKGETLADAIALLRDILTNQKNLSEAAKKRLEEEINRLLGGGKP